MRQMSEYDALVLKRMFWVLSKYCLLNKMESHKSTSAKLLMFYLICFAAFLCHLWLFSIKNSQGHCVLYRHRTLGKGQKDLKSVLSSSTYLCYVTLGRSSVSFPPGLHLFSLCRLQALKLSSHSKQTHVWFLQECSCRPSKYVLIGAKVGQKVVCPAYLHVHCLCVQSGTEAELNFTCPRF